MRENRESHCAIASKNNCFTGETSSQEENITNHQAAAVTINNATKIVDEYRDRERRKFNVVIYNAPESEAEDSSKRNKDAVSFMNAMTEELGIPLGETVQVVRLGHKPLIRNVLSEYSSRTLTIEGCC